MSARARRQPGAPSPPTPTRRTRGARARKQPGGVLPRAVSKRPSSRAVGVRGLYSLSPLVAPQLGQPRPGVHGPRRSSRGILRLSRRRKEAMRLSPPEGTDRDLHPLRWKPRRSSVSSAAAAANVCAQKQAALPDVESAAASAPEGVLLTELLPSFPAPPAPPKMMPPHCTTWQAHKAP